MAIDFNALVNAAQRDVQSNTNNFNEKKEEVIGSEYKLLYPYAAGTIVFRLLPNNKSNTVQRLITRHKIPDASNQYGSKNIICSNAHYGKSCPICNAIKNAQTMRGKDCDAFRKFGYKARGIAYAKIIQISPEYTDVKAGDVVLLMYPKSIYTEISNVILQNSDKLEFIFNKNNGCTFKLETKKSSTFPEYSVNLNLGFNGPVLAPVKDSQEEYDSFLEALPSLNDQFVPEVEPEDLYNSALAAADLINVTYGCVGEVATTINESNGSTLSNSFNPSKLDIVDDFPASNPVSPPPSNIDGKPSCFGSHDDTSMKCNMCPHEMSCLGIC